MNALSCVPLLALGCDVLALAAVPVAWRQMRRVQALTEPLRELAAEADDLRARIEGAPRRRLPPAPATTRSTKPPASSASPLAPAPVQPSALAEPLLPEPWPISELDRAVARVNDPLKARLDMLERWAHAGGVSPRELSPIGAQFWHLSRELDDAQTMTQVAAAEQEIEAGWPELLRAVVSRSDRDLDPARTDARLQAALAELLRDLGVSPIDPSPGEPFDPARHSSLGVSARGSAAQRGSVGEVCCRGLAAGERVLMKAEIREFD